MLELMTAGDWIGWTPVIGEALITWTPQTYYVAAGVLQVVLILIAFALLQVDPEINNFIGALIAAVAINVGGYFLRDTGLFGIIVCGALIFGSVVVISGGDALKGGVVGMLIIALYWGLGTGVIPRTPLTVDAVGGFTRVTMTGGIKAEPMTESDYDSIEKGRKAAGK